MSWPTWADEMWLDLNAPQLDSPHKTYTPREQKFIADIRPIFEHLAEVYKEPVSMLQSDLFHRLMCDRMDEYYRITKAHINAKHRKAKVVKNKTPWKAIFDEKVEWQLLPYKAFCRKLEPLKVSPPSESAYSRRKSK